MEYGKNAAPRSAVSDYCCTRRAEELLSQAFENHQAGRFDAAEHCYRQIIEECPERAEAPFYLGLLYLGRDETENATGCFRRALALDPDRPEIHYQLGTVCFNQGRLEDAVDCYCRAIDLDPSLAAAHYNLGVAYESLGRAQEAVFSYAEALQYNPNDIDAHFNLGLAFKKQGMLEEAAACFLNVRDRNPRDADSLYNLATVRKKQGRLDEAVTAYRSVLGIDPQYGPAHNNLGIIYLGQDKFGEAKECFACSLALGHNEASASHILAALSGETPSSAPREYVQELFDEYSTRFDESLLNELDYKTPRILKNLLAAYQDGSFTNAVDLGCGTGLSGAVFRGMAGRMSGVDLSSRMIAIADQKKIYDALFVDDIIEFLETTADRFDLFVASDVLVYLGDLTQLFKVVRKCAQQNACFVFSTETTARNPFVLRRTGRYAHGKEYVREIVRQYGFVVETHTSSGIRKEKGRWLAGDHYLVRYAG